MVWASKRNVAGATLLSLLVMSAGAMSTLLSTPYMERGSKTVTTVLLTSTRGPPGSGLLLVDLILGIRPSYYSLVDFPFDFNPVVHENVSISPQAPGGDYDSSRTNSSGFVEFSLPVSKYVVTINEARFRASIPVEILNDTETTIFVTMSRIAYPIALMELPGQYSADWIPPWSSIAFEIPSGYPLNSSEPIMLESQSSGSSVVAPSYVVPSGSPYSIQTSLTVVGQSQGQYDNWVYAVPSHGIHVPSSSARLILIQYAVSYKIVAEVTS